MTATPITTKIVQWARPLYTQHLKGSLRGLKKRKFVRSSKGVYSRNYKRYNETWLIADHETPGMVAITITRTPHKQPYTVRKPKRRIDDVVWEMMYGNG